MTLSCQMYKVAAIWHTYYLVDKLKSYYNPFSMHFSLSTVSLPSVPTLATIHQFARLVNQPAIFSTWVNRSNSPNGSMSKLCCIPAARQARGLISVQCRVSLLKNAKKLILCRFLDIFVQVYFSRAQEF